MEAYNKVRAENAELRERVKQLEAENAEQCDACTESEHRLVALVETLEKMREALRLVWSESRIEDFLPKTKAMAIEALTLQPQPARARKILEVVKKAKALKATFPTSHIWTHEQCMLYVALQCLDAEQP